MASETLKEITYDGKKVLTEAAKRDALGRVIDTTYYTKAQVDDKIKNFITTIPDELTPTKITMKDGAGTIEGIKQITNAGGSDGSFDIYCASGTTAGANPFVNFWNGYPATKGARLNLNNLTDIRIFNFPDKDGTLATTDDVNKGYSIRLHPGDIPGVADTATSATIVKSSIQPSNDIKIGDIVMDYYQPNENELDIGFWKVESISGDNITIKGTLDPELGDVKIKAPDTPVIKVKTISGSSATSDLQDLWDECGENILPLALYYEWSEDPRACEAVPFNLRWEDGIGASSSYRLFYLGGLVQVSGQDYCTSRWQEARNTDESSATFYLCYMKVNPRTGK